MVYVLRLQKELLNLKNNYAHKYFINETTVKYFINFLKVNKKIEICFYINNILLKINIIINDNYPFHPPKIYINSYKYIDLLIIPQKMLNLLTEECLCCNSILCDWVAIYNIKDILEEIEKNLKMKQIILERFLCKKIIDKYLIKDLDIILNYL
jgi:ubiquitin-protein ligase